MWHIQGRTSVEYSQKCQWNLHLMTEIMGDFQSQNYIVSWYFLIMTALIRKSGERRPSSFWLPVFPLILALGDLSFIKLRYIYNSLKLFNDYIILYIYIYMMNNSYYIHWPCLRSWGEPRETWWDRLSDCKDMEKEE